MNGLALCSGVGGLELGLRIATEGRHRVVCWVEREAYAAATLVARMEEQALDRAPVWDDITSFDGRPWRGLVDCVTAGIPCQPYSLAGPREGHEDERALWPELIRIVEECEPAGVFIENVPAFLKHTEPLFRHLVGLGFIAAPPLLQTAADKGAPHLRERVFILFAHPDRPKLWDEPGRRGRSSGRSASIARDSADSTANASGAGLALRSRPEVRRRAIRHEGQAVAWSDCEPTDAIEQPTTGPRFLITGGRSARRGGGILADANGGRLQAEWRGWLFNIERQTLRHDSNGCNPGCRICRTHWETESPPVRVDDGFPGRVDELRTIGNAVIPDMAAAAWTYLVQLLDPGCNLGFEATKPGYGLGKR